MDSLFQRQYNKIEPVTEKIDKMRFTDYMGKCYFFRKESRGITDKSRILKYIRNEHRLPLANQAVGAPIPAQSLQYLRTLLTFCPMFHKCKKCLRT